MLDKNFKLAEMHYTEQVGCKKMSVRNKIEYVNVEWIPFQILQQTEHPKIHRAVKLLNVYLCLIYITASCLQHSLMCTITEI